MLTRDMQRRAFLRRLAALAAAQAALAAQLPANKNVRWALGTNLWNYFPRVAFTDILDCMRDTGFIGARLTQFPRILDTYNLTPTRLHKEMDKRGLHIVTISFNGAFQDSSARPAIFTNARAAMEFLRDFGARDLVVFSPSRKLPGALTPQAFTTMCESFNQLGDIAGEMGFRAGLHNHLGQMVQTPEEIDRCMSQTDPRRFHFSPDTAHVHLAGGDVAATLARYRSRIAILDYKDARRAALAQGFREAVFDLGDGEIDFPACHRVLKSMSYRGWICVDLDIARQGPKASYQRCGAYITKTLEPIYV
jgi:inosose dehydratase